VSSVIPEVAQTGMGALPHANGVAFRVWAPHASAVYVTGTFNEWSPESNRMANERAGYWYADNVIDLIP
jgi:1,4-alpha-glucan branching enzyme